MNHTSVYMPNLMEKEMVSLFVSVDDMLIFGIDLSSSVD